MCRSVSYMPGAKETDVLWPQGAIGLRWGWMRKKQQLMMTVHSKLFDKKMSAGEWRYWEWAVMKFIRENSWGESHRHRIYSSELGCCQEINHLNYFNEEFNIKNWSLNNWKSKKRTMYCEDSNCRRQLLCLELGVLREEVGIIII